MNVYEQTIVEPFGRFYEKVLQFLPELFTAIAILVAGIITGMILKLILRRVFTAVHLDKFMESVGAAEIIRKGWIKESPSVVISRMAGWLTVFIFAVISMSAISVPAVDRLIERFFLYLPNIFVAAVILFSGYFLSNFLGMTALIAAVNADIRVSGLMGKAVKFAVFLLAVTMALEQLGIGSGTVIIAFAILFGGFVLALAIAFGLGGRDLAKAYLEKKSRGEEKKDEIDHL